MRYEIYLIHSRDYWYVGSTTRGAIKRRNEHYAGRGRAPLLKAKIRELGSEAFSFRVLEVGMGDPIQAEQKWYDWKLTTDVRQSLNSKRPDSWDGWNRGKPFSSEAREKMSLAHAGKKRSPHSAETLEKMSRTKKGKPGHPQSSETRAKISAALKGRSRSPEIRAKISATKRGISA